LMPDSLFIMLLEKTNKNFAGSARFHYLLDRKYN